MNFSTEVLIGAGVLSLGAFAIHSFVGGLSSEAGKDVYKKAKEMINPPEPEDVEVDRNYEPPNKDVNEYRWSRPTNLLDAAGKGWKHFPHPEQRGRCYRETREGNGMERSYLMFKPKT